MSDRETVTVLGAGVASRCAAHLAAECGWRVNHRGGRSSLPPAWLLDPVTFKLLGDLTGLGSRGSFHPIRHRRLRWGRRRERFGATGYVVLPDTLCQPDTTRQAAEIDGWCFDTRPPHCTDAGVMRFGRRTAIAGVHEDRDEPHTADLAATDDRWLFRLPIGGGRCLVQVVMPMDAPPSEPSALLSESIERGGLSAQVGSVISNVVTIPAEGYLRRRPVTGRTVAAGAGAIAVDPLCGDGVGFALRSCVWAVAVMRMLRIGASDAAQAYELRLRRTMCQHAATLASFYRSAGFVSDGWRDEVQTLEQCAARLALPKRPCYTLELDGGGRPALVRQETASSHATVGSMP